MRQLILILVSFCGVQLVAAQGPSVSHPLDTSSGSTPTASTILADTLWRIAVESGVPIGLESVDQPMKPANRIDSVPAFSGGNPTESLNAALSMDRRYEWRFIDDMVVVRPKTGWTDSDDPLNLHVQNLEIASATVGSVLYGLQRLIYSNRLELRQSSGDRVSLNVPSGSVLHVLNQLTKTADGVMWLADYRRGSQPPLKLWVRGPETLRAFAQSPIRRGTRR